VTYQYGCRLQWSWSVIVCKGDPRKIMQTTPAEAREGPRTTIGNNRPLARQPNLWITKVGEQRGWSMSLRRKPPAPPLRVQPRCPNPTLATLVVNMLTMFLSWRGGGQASWRPVLLTQQTRTGSSSKAANRKPRLDRAFSSTNTCRHSVLPVGSSYRR